MAIHQESCDVCDQIFQCDSGIHPREVAELRSGWVVMGESQYLEGYCLLLVREPATEIFELSASARASMWRDLEALAEAVALVTSAHKLNYEALGNQCHHMHWHIFPRQLREPNCHLPIWNSGPDGNDAAKFSYRPELHDRTRLAIRAHLLKNLAQ